MRLFATMGTLMCVAFLVFAAPTFAHEGHDDGAPVVPSPTSGQPRTVAVSEDFEIVAVPRGVELIIYVDRFSDNSPATAANLVVTVGTEEIRAVSISGGVFKLRSDSLVKPGKHDLIFSVQDGEKSDLLIATLDVPVTVHDESDVGSAPASLFARLNIAVAQLTTLQIGVVAGGLLGLGFVSTLFRRRRNAGTVRQISGVPAVRGTADELGKIAKTFR